ncbi:hypothetical protein GF312_11810 [Candidatus Poribacteria bacterium]|nr:hypothetical protein [Candidatus Poribacteria bacterium]
MQDPVAEQKTKDPVLTRVYKENGVIYCASSTSKGVYCYRYALNNPLKYADPSGYKIGILAQTASGIQDDIGPIGSAGGGISWPRYGTLHSPRNDFEYDIMMANTLSQYGFTDGYQEVKWNLQSGRYNRSLKYRWEQVYINPNLNPDPSDRDYIISEVSTAMRKVWYYETLTSQNSNPYNKTHGLPVYSVQDFWIENRDRSYFQIINQEPRKDGLPGGPTMRMVINPNDGRIMDMRHVMVVGFGGTMVYQGNPVMGNVLGLGIELIQWFGPYFGKDIRGSAFDRQDIYSNKVGSSFGTYYFYTGKFTKDWSTSFHNWLIYR